MANKLLATALLIASAPVWGIAAIAVWLEDRQSPFFRTSRVGQDGRTFTMFKLRSMASNAALAGIDSTSASDPRITRVGRVIRLVKADELPQFFNVIRGEMRFVGPRPNVRDEVALYSPLEQELLTAPPGMTSLASVVFADLGEIIDGAEDANLAYNQIVRPYKSRLDLLLVQNRRLAVSAVVISATFANMFSRRLALRMCGRLARRLGADDCLAEVAARRRSLTPAPPPGMSEVVRHARPAQEPDALGAR